MVALYEAGFERRGLAHAVWGHLADGNLHPNALPESAAETERGVEALFEFADAAVARGGCPLSEHGVGRNRLKQELLRRFVGPAAIERMREIKRALDPPGRFAPGVLFPAATPESPEAD
jgi:FAD/FMN-containing dehydrogenase